MCDKTCPGTLTRRDFHCVIIFPASIFQTPWAPAQGCTQGPAARGATARTVTTWPASSSPNRPPLPPLTAGKRAIRRPLTMAASARQLVWMPRPRTTGQIYCWPGRPSAIQADMAAENRRWLPNPAVVAVAEAVVGDSFLSAGERWWSGQTREWPICPASCGCPLPGCHSNTSSSTSSNSSSSQLRLPQLWAVIAGSCENFSVQCTVVCNKIFVSVPEHEPGQLQYTACGSVLHMVSWFWSFSTSESSADNVTFVSSAY